MTDIGKPHWWSRLKAWVKRAAKACAFLDGKGCACAGQGLIHELEVSKREQSRQQSAKGAENADLTDSHRPQS
ncbi:MAG: hypothetical protein K6F05_00060 [Succinivibrio sp.]|nr:hypothetical protein [Succinivibrio sp.]